jgi:hypothetical protein
MCPARIELDVAYIEQRSIPEPNSGCWLWIGTEAPGGYGFINLRGRRMTAQRGSYLMFKGAIPDGLEIDHLCRNPGCVNPDHLEAVTHQENCRRRDAVRTACPRGHVYDDHVDARGSRRCRKCAAIARTRRLALSNLGAST